MEGLGCRLIMEGLGFRVRTENWMEKQMDN